MVSPVQLSAFHEAGHTVAAMFTRYHTVPWQVRAYQNGHGECQVGFSRRRCEAQGVKYDPSIPTIASETALIMCAGYEAERIFAVENGATADAAASQGDYDAALRFVNAEQLEAAKLKAATLVERHWFDVQRIAHALLAAPGQSAYSRDLYDLVGIAVPVPDQ